MYQSTDSTLVVRFRKAIQTEIEDKRYSISQGNMSDIVAYKEMCAQIQGLATALDMFEDILQKLKIDDEN